MRVAHILRLVRGRSFLVVLALMSGCNQVFGIEGTEVETVDEDGDGIIGTDDSCPLVANPDQRDLDEDGVGDACDNCPMAANTDQGSIGDGDAFGDACDPHADRPGDCLIAFDTFQDPTAFASAWDVSPGSVEPFPGGVRVTAGARQAMFARDRDGIPLQGDFDITVLADVPSPVAGGRLAVATHASVTVGHWCSLMTGNGLAEVARVTGPPSSSSGMLRAMSAPPFGARTRIQLRHIVDLGLESRLACRVDQGVALGTQSIQTLGLATGTPPRVGLIIEGLDVSIHGVVISRFQPDTPCPEPILR